VLPRANDPARRISAEVVENAWQRIRAHARVPDVRIHDLRHTVGTWAADSGANAFQIRDLLRHSTIAMTSRYVNRSNDPLRALTNIIGDQIGAALGPKPVVSEGSIPAAAELAAPSEPGGKRSPSRSGR
jgi:Phage integrase family